jgi:hypothetical protein
MKNKKMNEIESRAEGDRIYRIRLAELQGELIKLGSGYMVDT